MLAWSASIDLLRLRYVLLSSLAQLFSQILTISVSVGGFIACAMANTLSLAHLNIRRRRHKQIFVLPLSSSSALSSQRKDRSIWYYMRSVWEKLSQRSALMHFKEICWSWPLRQMLCMLCSLSLSPQPRLFNVIANEVRNYKFLHSRDDTPNRLGSLSGAPSCRPRQIGKE